MSYKDLQRRSVASSGGAEGDYLTPHSIEFYRTLPEEFAKMKNKGKLYEL